MKLLTFSIITPSYNHGQFIEATIKSILSQEGNFYIDYIIMDGGSKDNSVEIIKKYDQLLKEGKWPVKCKGISYRWESEKDNGQVDAINKGFTMCKGDILDWINSDDRLLPHSLASVVKEVANYPEAGAWVGACNLIDKKGKLYKTILPYGLTKDQMADWGVKGHFFQPSCFFSKKGWKKYGPLDDTFYCCFDVNFYLKMISEYKFIGTKSVWSEVVVHNEAKTYENIHLMRAERFVIQARHGYERLAISNIEKFLKEDIKPWWYSLKS